MASVAWSSEKRKRMFGRSAERRVPARADKLARERRIGCMRKPYEDERQILAAFYESSRLGLKGLWRYKEGDEFI